MLSGIAVILAYQVGLPIQMATATTNPNNLSGFYVVESQGGHTFRWSKPNAAMTFTGIGKTTPLLITVEANAWRDPSQVYGASVTLNGRPIGEIDRAQWRTWRFSVNDPNLLSADRLIIGFNAKGFSPRDLFPESDDGRELGIAVESVEVTPQSSLSSTIGGWIGLVTNPSVRQVAFVACLIPALYLISQVLGLADERAFYLGIGASILSFIGFAFFRLLATESVLILTLIVGVIALGQILRSHREGAAAGASAADTTHTYGRAKWLIAAGIILVAFLLRLNAMTFLPGEGDEADYNRVAEQYYQLLRSSNWHGVIALGGIPDHPRFNTLLLGFGMAVRDAAHLALTNEQMSRLVAVIFGSLQAGMLALVNPLAGWFLAIQSTEVKFTSMIYLEAVPAFTATASILSFEKFRRTNRNGWLYLSAIALGATGASKFIYLTAGFAILPFLLWEQRKNLKRILVYGVIAVLVFFGFDPYLWYDPLGRLAAMYSFQLSFSARDYVQSLGRPFWYILTALAQPAKIYVPVEDYPPAFLIVWDLAIYIVGLLGIVSLTRRSLLYFAWLLSGVIFVSFWQAKWEQYAMVIATPLCLAAGLAIFDGWRWLEKRVRVGATVAYSSKDYSVKS